MSLANSSIPILIEANLKRKIGEKRTLSRVHSSVLDFTSHMPSSSTSFSSCSVRIIRNCIPSLHLFSTTNSSPRTVPPEKWPVELVEAVCIAAFGLTAQIEAEGKWTHTE